MQMKRMHFDTKRVKICRYPSAGSILLLALFKGLPEGLNEVYAKEEDAREQKAAQVLAMLTEEDLSSIEDLSIEDVHNSLIQRSGWSRSQRPKGNSLKPSVNYCGNWRDAGALPVKRTIGVATEALR